MERLLEGVDCVLYLLDYTKLKTAEEEGLFRRLRAINPQLVARLSSRLFFIVNKVGGVGGGRSGAGREQEEVPGRRVGRTATLLRRDAGVLFYHFHAFSCVCHIVRLPHP